MRKQSYKKGTAMNRAKQSTVNGPAMNQALDEVCAAMDALFQTMKPKDRRELGKMLHDVTKGAQRRTFRTFFEKIKTLFSVIMQKLKSAAGKVKDWLVSVWERVCGYFSHSPNHAYAMA